MSSIRRRIGTRISCAGALALLGTGLVYGQAGAQEDLRLEAFRPHIEILTATSGARQFSDTTGDLRRGRLLLKLNVPLAPPRVHSGGKLLGHQLFAQILLGRTPTEIGSPGLEREVDFLTGSLMLGGLMATRKGNLFLLMLGASVAEEKDTIDDPDPFFSGLGLFVDRRTEKLAFLYGVAASYPYRLEFVTPVLGVRWQYRPRWSLFAAAPFLARTTYSGSEKTKLHFLIAFAGDQSRFANQGALVPEPDVLFLKTKQLRLGAKFDYHLSRTTVLTFEAGVLTEGSLEVTTERDRGEIFSTDLDSAGYIQLAWRRSFGKTLGDEMGPPPASLP